MRFDLHEESLLIHGLLLKSSTRLAELRSTFPSLLPSPFLENGAHTVYRIADDTAASRLFFESGTLHRVSTSLRLPGSQGSGWSTETMAEEHRRRELHRQFLIEQIGVDSYRSESGFAICHDFDPKGCSSAIHVVWRSLDRAN